MMRQTKQDRHQGETVRTREAALIYTNREANGTFKRLPGKVMLC